MCSRSSMRSLQDIKVCVIASSNTAFLLVVCAQRHTGLIPGRGGDNVSVLASICFLVWEK